MNQEEIDLVAQAGVAKYTLSKTCLPRYFVRAVMAGFYLAIGMFACNICYALFAESIPAVGKVLGAFIFGAGLVTIVMLGGDLFTGTNMVMCVSTLERKTPVSGMLRVWLWSYLGNAVGSVLLGLIFVGGGSMNALLAPVITAGAAAKLSLTVGQMILRGILCNFVVCAAVLAGIKIKDASARILTILLLIFCFVVAGYEHSVANMGYYTLAFALTPGLPVGALLRSMLWVTVGNILGGAVFMGLPYWIMSKPAGRK